MWPSSLIFKKTAHNTQSPNRRKFAQSGRPEFTESRLRFQATWGSPGSSVQQHPGIVARFAARLEESGRTGSQQQRTMLHPRQRIHHLNF
jgi:hypothetical protein